MHASVKKILAALAVGASSLVLSATPAASAAPAITPAVTAIARGADLGLTATGCAEREVSDETLWFQVPEIVLISGSGAAARLAGAAQGPSDGEGTGEELAVRVPGWVDPGQPAVLAGRCVRHTFDQDAGVVRTEVFTYPDVAVDVTDAPTSVAGPLFTLDRTSAAGGQVLVASGSGCAAASRVEAVVLAETDLSGRSGITVVGGGFLEDPVTGPFSVELPLIGRGLFVDGEDGSGAGALPEGPYSVTVACVEPDDEMFTVAAPQAITVVGTNPSHAISIDQSGSDSLTLQGEGCTGGRAVTATFTGYAGLEEYEEIGEELMAPAARLGGAGTRLAPDTEGAFTEVVTATPDGDGRWSLEWSTPAAGYDVRVVADCGDPTADGFRYVEQYWYDSNFADLWIERTSPTSSPTGGPVTVHLQGECEDPGTVRFTNAAGEVFDEAPLSAVDPYGTGSGYGTTKGTLTAPSTAGTYRLVGTCDSKPSYPETYDVFAPTTLASEGPLPGEPTTGWPSSGPRQVYRGRIGPITLPAMDDMDDGATMAAVEKALGPSGLFIDVPRPSGDFAVNKISFDLVDEDGMSVPQHEAHLHHFVITNRSAENPACPNGTFGLPGEIVGAAGAEKTVLDMADPYGLVVKGSDSWTGVYELMSRSQTARTVYLTYDMTIRRDVENVRPIHRYFGSATGCSSFTWTIDGSGQPDVQSGYVTMAHDGVLLGAGGHIHSGGLHADLTDDRGRRLCRSELQLGDMPMHPPGHGTMGGAGPRDMTETTVVEGPIGEPGTIGYPPEFYDDDPEILGITSCGLGEKVTKGQRFRFDAVYENDRPRSGVMGIYSLFVWEGGGPAAPIAAP
ncbi:MAG: hypothetical protein JWM47_3302, partial [Acidimicrobiales bacterium]|nr:hypothetical protein [Acidimicrobiales bacterium]